MMALTRKVTRRLTEIIGWSIVRTLPLFVIPNKIVVSSYYTRGYSDNPKAVIDELIKKRADITIVFISDTQPRLNTEFKVKFVKPYSFRAIYHLATAKIWIDNARKSRYTYKKKGQYYMQTWHGFALKKIEADAASKLSKRYISSAINDSKMCDIIISDSTHMSNIYKNSFWYDGEVVEYGSPRTDILINNSPEKAVAIRERLGIPQNKRIITYAPTFREKSTPKTYSIDTSAVINEFKKKFGGEWIIVLRLHPNIAEQLSPQISTEADVVDLSHYHDPQEILLITDSLITDYSSIMFDFMLTGKPGFLYANDRESYEDERGFYFRLEDIPYSLATSGPELTENISTYNSESQTLLIKKFINKTGLIGDGRASARAAAILKGWLN